MIRRVPPPALCAARLESLRRATGRGTPLWIDVAWDYGYRSPWKA